MNFVQSLLNMPATGKPNTAQEALINAYNEDASTSSTDA